MPRCRVYAMPGGTVVIVHPALKSLRPGESEAEWYARAMARTEEASPELIGRPFVDCDATDLPPRESRSRWRLRNGVVVEADP